MRAFITVLCAATLICLLGCAGATVTLELPKTVEGGWKQQSAEALDASKKPEWMQRLGVKDAQLAKFAGPTDVEVLWFQMNSSAAALECMQLWKKAPTQTVMMKDNYFVVFESNHPNREALMDFSRGFERAL
jgi:hypothetical protein